MQTVFHYPAMKPPPITKSQALEKWSKELQNEHLRLSDPEAFLGIATWRLSEMEKLGLLDPLELYELGEQAHAAYSAGLEEQFAQERYCQSALYNVVPDGKNERIATISHGVYSREIADDAIQSSPCYHGRVTITNGRVHLVMSYPLHCLPISGLRFVTEDGISCCLVETTRLIEGKWLTGVNDPDAYRVLIDLGQEAFEKKDWARYHNVAPTTPVAVLRVNDARPRADLVRWGWRPHRATDRAAPINARVEKVAHGPFFPAIWPHRAITPVDGWYEWVDEGGPKKQPYYIRRRDGCPALCASIGQFTGSEHDGFVIITADAQGGMVDVHDRRPIVLSAGLAKAWIDPATPLEHAEQLALFMGEPAQEFEWFKVGQAVGNVRNQGPDLIKPI